MTLGQKQRKFSLMAAQFICWVYEQGYEVSFGDFSRLDGQGHTDGSFHYKRLAMDLNLFKDGKYLRSTEDHRMLGEKWESMGGTWGGRFRKADGNHYSYGESR